MKTTLNRIQRAAILGALFFCIVVIGRPANSQTIVAHSTESAQLTSLYLR